MANPNRKKVEEYIYSLMDTIDRSGKNTQRYRDKFKGMSDTEFDAFMKDIQNGTEDIYVYAANMKDHIDNDDIYAAADKIGLVLFERIRCYDAVTDSYYLTPYEYLIIETPIRRFSQFVDHKLSVPEGDTRVDMLTGQVMKPDKAGSLSQIEVQTLHAKGLQNTIDELVSVRGGNMVEYAEFRRELEEQGGASLQRSGNSVNRAAISLDGFYAAMHIDSNASGV